VGGSLVALSFHCFLKPVSAVYPDGGGFFRLRRHQASRGSATAGFDSRSYSHGNVIIPSSGFFRSFAAVLDLTQIDPCAFAKRRVPSITIPRHVQILCSECFLKCKSLSSISFETQSELTRIESKAFACSSLESITIPRHVQILCSEFFSNCKFLSSISFEIDSELIYRMSHSGLASEDLCGRALE
jgi:hypothetical protein